MTDFAKVQDSGQREEFGTGSKRDTRVGKGRFDLIPSYALSRLARHFENGAVKYGDWNWSKGQPLSRYLDSALRHLIKLKAGFRDEDHASAVAWNVLCFIETEKKVQKGILPKELNDLEEEYFDWSDEAKEAIAEVVEEVTVSPAPEPAKPIRIVLNDENRQLFKLMSEGNEEARAGFEALLNNAVVQIINIHNKA